MRSHSATYYMTYNVRGIIDEVLIINKHNCHCGVDECTVRVSRRRTSTAGSISVPLGFLF